MYNKLQLLTRRNEVTLREACQQAQTILFRYYERALRRLSGSIDFSIPCYALKASISVIQHSRGGYDRDLLERLQRQ